VTVRGLSGRLIGRQKHADTDPLEREIELALNPGVFIPDGACFSFVGALTEVAVKIETLTDTDPTRAITLHETFLAGCYEKAEEVDDSSGSFGQCVDELFCGWIKARQADGADPDETATRLLGWMDDDRYGFCYHLERDAVGVFNKAGLAAFVRQVRGRLDGAANATADGSSKDRPEYIRRRWVRLCALSILPRRIARPTLPSPRRRGLPLRIAMLSPRCSSPSANQKSLWPGWNGDRPQQELAARVHGKFGPRQAQARNLGQARTRERGARRRLGRLC